MSDAMIEGLQYQSGFGNQFSSEAVPVAHAQDVARAEGEACEETLSEEDVLAHALAENVARADAVSLGDADADAEAREETEVRAVMEPTPPRPPQRRRRAALPGPSNSDNLTI